MSTGIITLNCLDEVGIISQITSCLSNLGLNIIKLDQFSTLDKPLRFYCRVEVSFDPAREEDLLASLTNLCSGLDAEVQFKCSSTPLKMGILASKTDHCLEELLYRWRSGDIQADIPFIIANHETLRPIADRYDIPFHFIPANSSDRKEEEILNLLYDTDFTVLARYMQILSPDFLERYGNDIINIHHSFLPSFMGANPYKQAYERGVKIIGATAHFVTSDLDEGPIITQSVEHVTHKDTVESLKRKGKSLERMAFTDAVQLYTEHRIIRMDSKTIIFG